MAKFSKEIYRVLDANVNRAREGLRVLEDVARFVFNDEKLTHSLRNHRHYLDKITREVYPQLVLARQAKSDLGEKFKEPKRKNLAGLIISNFKRVEEAVRVLEEFGKLISATAGKKFKKIRFQIYDLEKDVLKKVNL